MCSITSQNVILYFDYNMKIDLSYPVNKLMVQLVLSATGQHHFHNAVWL